MRKVSNFRGACVWLAAAMLLVAAASADASRLNVGEVVKQVIPKVGQQLSKVAVNGKVAITAACVAAACVINFAAPGHAADFLTSDSELMKTRGSSAIFAPSSSRVDKGGEDPGLNFSHSVGKGIYHESGDTIGSLRLGTSVSGKNFNAYATVDFRSDYSTIDGIDGIEVKTRTYWGANGLLINKGDGNVSYGYLNADAFVGGSTMFFRNARAHLLRYHKGPFQVAALGYEYIDNDLNTLSNVDESGDAVRSHGVALYRAGINYPITDLFTTSDALAINIKLNSAMHLGDIGPVKLGETWQGELNDWAGEGADLDHLLYHSAGGSINVSLADDRINLSFGGGIQHTIDGDIKRSGMADGDFDIVNTAVGVGGTIDLLPDHNISLEGYFESYTQSVDANLDGKMHDADYTGTWSRVVLKKTGL